MRYEFRKSNQVVQWINKTNYVRIFQRYLSTNFQKSVQKSTKKRFYEICYCYIKDYTFVQSQFFQ